MKHDHESPVTILPSDPERWSDGASNQAPGETVGAAFRRAQQVTAPSDLAVTRVVRRIAAAPRARVGWRFWHVALAASVILATGGAVGAARGVWHIGPIGITKRQPAAAVPVAARSIRRHAGAAVPAPTVPAPLDVSVLPVVEEPPPVGAAPVGPSPPAVVTPSLSAPIAHGGVQAVAPTSEASALGDAFRQLRSQRDATAALRSLDLYDRRFPGGLLRGEARIARAEALIALDRRSDALSLLRAIPEDDGGLTRNVRITRGELQAETGRCAEAVVDFNRLLASTDRDGAGARALFARASCRLQDGAVALAAQDLRRYLLIHPDGTFAAAARRALEALP
jgi:hypothetical protein